MQNTQRNYNFVGIKGTLEAIPHIESCDIDAKDEAIAEFKTALEKITFLAEQGYLFDEKVASYLVAKGDLKMLKFCVEELFCPVKREAFSIAAENGHVECMLYLQKQKHDLEDAFYRADKHNQATCFSLCHHT